MNYVGSSPNDSAVGSYLSLEEHTSSVWSASVAVEDFWKCSSDGPPSGEYCFIVDVESSSVREQGAESERLEQRFRDLVSQWRRETRLTSSLDELAMHPAYQRIIGLGPAVLPLLLEELSERPDHWFWALKAISDEDPVRDDDKGRLGRMKEAWLEWGRREKLI